MPVLIVGCLVLALLLLITAGTLVSGIVDHRRRRIGPSRYAPSWAIGDADRPFFDNAHRESRRIAAFQCRPRRSRSRNSLLLHRQSVPRPTGRFQFAKSRVPPTVWSLAQNATPARKT